MTSARPRRIRTRSSETQGSGERSSSGTWDSERPVQRVDEGHLERIEKHIVQAMDFFRNTPSPSGFGTVQRQGVVLNTRC